MRFLLRLGLYPGFVRGITGTVIGALALALTYVSIANGGIFLITALALLLMGLLLDGVRGMVFGAVFVIPLYVLLHWPVPPQTADFGTILIALIVYLAIIPGGIVQAGFLMKRWWGAVIASALVVPAYITFLVAFPFPAGAGPNNGATLVFGALGATLGLLWGIGAISPGASAHEGPAYYAAQKPLPEPGRQLPALARKYIPILVQTFQPFIRPIGIAIGVALVLTVAFVLIGTSPITPLRRPQTSAAAADALAVTGDKFIAFVVVALVIIGAVVGMAVGLALLIRTINSQVTKAKAAPAEPLKQQPPLFRLLNFFLSWLADILGGLGGSVQR